MSQAPSPDEAAVNREKRRRAVSRMMDPRTYGIDPSALTTPAAVGDALTRLRSAGCNLIGPEVHLSSLPRMYAVSLRFALLDPYDPPMVGANGGKKSNGIWYEQNGGGLSPHYTALNSLARMCGVNWLDFQRTDAGMTPLYWRFAGRASIKLLDGRTIDVYGTGESDLRDSSAEINGLSAQRLAGMRAKGSQRAESIAKARILRELMCLRQKYSEAEAAQPFVFPALEFQQPADPELDRLVAMREMGLLDTLYGGRGNVIDVTPKADPPRLAAPVDGVDFAAENARLERERAARVPAYADPDEDPDDMPDFGAAPSAPAEDPNARTWSGYSLAEVRDFFAATGRPDRPDESPEKREQVCAWLATPKGKERIDAFLRATGGRS